MHLQLFVKLYPETLQSSGTVEAFVRAIWDLVGGGKRPGVADDGVWLSSTTCQNGRAYALHTFLACVTVPTLHRYRYSDGLLQGPLWLKRDHLWSCAGCGCTECRFTR